ncbi:MAG: hypothetical protein CMN77_16345 [Spirochaetaceae bacterium]|nr:hypothetical protein [Spirochaetaceae bacterium]|tara:strand:+ start:5043 stop:5939 length:897 start_codon:yes stop_codon:yes gene_type:complete
MQESLPTAAADSLTSMHGFFAADGQRVHGRALFVFAIWASITICLAGILYPGGLQAKPQKGDLFAQMGLGPGKPSGELIQQATEDPLGSGLQLVRLNNSGDSIDQALALAIVSDRTRPLKNSAMLDFMLGYYIEDWLFLGAGITSLSVILERVRTAPPDPELEILNASGFFADDPVASQTLQTFFRLSDIASLRRGREEFERFNTLDFKVGIRFPSLDTGAFDPYINGTIGLGTYGGGATIARLGAELGTRYYFTDTFLFSEIDVSQTFLTYPGSAVPGNGSPVVASVALQIGAGMDF